MRPLRFSHEKKKARGINTDRRVSNMRTCDFQLLGDVARRLGCQPYQIVYLLTTGQVPEPARLGNRRLFGKQDVERIAERLGVDLEPAIEEAR
jgi:hypothetical protein